MTTLFSAGDCPVCSDRGARLYLKRIDGDELFFYCPRCSGAWPEVQPMAYKRTLSLRELAPHGCRAANGEERRGCTVALVEVPYAAWAQILEAERRFSRGTGSVRGRT